MTQMYKVFLHVSSTSALAEAFQPARVTDTELLMLLSFLFHARAFTLPPPPQTICLWYIYV